MRKMTAGATSAANLRLVTNKPEPDKQESILTPKETEILNAILEKGVSYIKQLSIDSIDTPRQTQTIKFNVVLSPGKTKMDLYSYFKNDLKISLISTGSQGESIVEALEEAERNGIIRLKELK